MENSASLAGQNFYDCFKTNEIIRDCEWPRWWASNWTCYPFKVFDSTEAHPMLCLHFITILLSDISIYECKTLRLAKAQSIVKLGEIEGAAIMRISRIFECWEIMLRLAKQLLDIYAKCFWNKEKKTFCFLFKIKRKTKDGWMFKIFFYCF